MVVEQDNNIIILQFLEDQVVVETLDLELQQILEQLIPVVGAVVAEVVRRYLLVVMVVQV